MKNLTDNDLIDIARKAAVGSTHRYNYIPATTEDALQWFPHRWVIDAMRALLAAPVVERQPEPEAFMYQHDETGQIGFVDIQQVEWGFEKNNPRLKIICPLYRSPPAPVAVTLPTPISSEDGPHYSDNRISELGYLTGYNACLDKVKEMNQ